MTQLDDARRQSRAPREHVSTLIAALRRIHATLHLDTVLGEVVESTRALTGARYGVSVTLDEAGAPQDPMFSGLAPGEERKRFAWLGNARLSGHLRTLADPLRVADFTGYVRALGIESDRTFFRTLQGTPMRQRDVEAGSFFFADKADGAAFTAEDEEVLGLFASPAAAAITNARAHRSERRMRADLEALVETSPVGVVVFDAKSGRAVSFNREMRRIGEDVSAGRYGLSAHPRNRDETVGEEFVVAERAPVAENCGLDHGTVEVPLEWLA